MAKAQARPHVKKAPNRKAGILPVQAIRGLIEAGQVKLAQPLLANQLQPASLDLRLGGQAFRVRASFLPGAGAVTAKLQDLHLHTIDLSKSAVLETGCVYIVPLLESMALPPELAAATNPKSSTGRLDVFTRVIADGVTAFDQVPAGYHGPLYAEICPQTFPIVVRTGSRLSQIRFRAGPTQDDDLALVELHAAKNSCRAIRPTSRTASRSRSISSATRAASSAFAPSATPAWWMSMRRARVRCSTSGSRSTCAGRSG